MNTRFVLMAQYGARALPNLTPMTKLKRKITALLHSLATF